MRRTAGVSAGLFALLAAWSVVPLVAIAARASARGEWFSGADAPTMFDQLQYFAWIREASDHFFVSNLFRIGPSQHVFADPMFLVSAAVHRLGFSVAASYLVWLPVAVAVLALGPLAYARARLSSTGPAAVAAVVGIFFLGPLFLLAHWTGALPDAGDATLGQAAATLFPGVMLLGGLPFAIAIGLVPVALLCAERGRTGWAAVVALVVAWIHPWQGEQIALACAGALAFERRWSWDLAAPIVAVAFPIAYFAALGHWDADWHTARVQAEGLHVSAWAWIVAVAPLALLAAAGVRDPRAADADTRGAADARGKALLLAWPLACIVAFLVTPSVPAHALIGISFPLAILAVRGWLRLGWSPVAGIGLAAALVVAASVYIGQVLHDSVTAGTQPYSITRSDRDALGFLDRDTRPGAVLARTYSAALVPGLTGRQTWVGHNSWTPDFVVRARLAERLLTTDAPQAKAVGFVRATGARYVLADCAARARIATVLAPIVAQVHRFGCARVLELR